MANPFKTTESKAKANVKVEPVEAEPIIEKEVAPNNILKDLKGDKDKDKKYMSFYLDAEVADALVNEAKERKLSRSQLANYIFRQVLLGE